MFKELAGLGSLMKNARQISGRVEEMAEKLSAWRTTASAGGGMVEISSNKFARPEFFILAHTFIKDYIEGRFFKKEEMLIDALEELDFPSDDGPVGAMRAEQEKSMDAAQQFLGAAKEWKEGDEKARTNVSWATSEYISTLRQHLARLKNLVLPLLEQNLSMDDEHLIAVAISSMVFEEDTPDKYSKLLETLEEELYDWR